MPTLTIQLPGRPPVEHALREEVITLGRIRSNTIALENSSVSQSHAQITRLGSDYFLKDLKSTNGTMLNGQSVGEARLRDGDQLKFGEVVAIFRLGSGSTPAPTHVIPATTPASAPASKSETSALPAMAKTSLLKPVLAKPEVVPPAAPPEKNNSTTLILGILGGVAAACAVSFLAWRLTTGDTTKPTVAAQPKEPPQTTPTQNTPATNKSTAIVEPPPTAEATSPPVRSDPRSLPELLTALRSQDVSERRLAAQAINDIGSDTTNVVLNLRVALLQDADPEVRMWLAFALVNNQTYDQAAVPVLIETLKNENATLRQKACAALALIPFDESGKATVVPALKAALKAATEDDSEDVRKTARTALKTIAPEEVPGK